MKRDRKATEKRIAEIAEIAETLQRHCTGIEKAALKSLQGELKGIEKVKGDVEEMIKRRAKLLKHT